MKKNWPILVVDDEEVMCESMGAWLREDGYHVDTASNGQKALELAKSTDYAICFVDLKMPGGMDGIETMMEIHRIRPDASIIIITAYATVDTAIQAMKEGAQEYIVKPCNPQEISMLVSRILKLKKLQSENAILRKKLNRQYRHFDIITKNPRMAEILALTQEVSEPAQHGSDSRRKWHGQRAGRTSGTFLRQSGRETIHRRKLCRAN